MTYDGERWRLATVGDWQPSGRHLPQPDRVLQLQQICRDLHNLFPAVS
jgi:endonuclease I